MAACKWRLKKISESTGLGDDRKLILELGVDVQKSLRTLVYTEHTRTPNFNKHRKEPEMMYAKCRRNFVLLDEALSLSKDEFQSKYGVHKPEGDGSDLVFHCFMGRRGGMAVQKAEKVGLGKWVR